MNIYIEYSKKDFTYFKLSVSYKQKIINFFKFITDENFVKEK